MRRKVQDVVLHDPRGHDEHRLGARLGRGGRVLDQLHQPVAQHDLARGHGHLAPGREALGSGGRLFGHEALEVIQPVVQAAREVGPSLAPGALQHDGVGEQPVAGRKHVQALPRGEGNHLLVMRRHAPHVLRGRLPPLLLQQKSLVVQVEGPPLPGRVGKAAVLHGRLGGQGLIALQLRGPQAIGQQQALRVGQQLSAKLPGQTQQLKLPAGAGRQVRGPVRHGQGH